jgi:putative membrane protein insertion efficiency factor
VRKQAAIVVLALLLVAAAIDAQRAPKSQWGAHAALAVIDGWQALTADPHRPGGCRYTPTCSVYGELAIRRYGAYRGAWLALARIMRCTPWADQIGEDWLK